MEKNVDSLILMNRLSKDAKVKLKLEGDWYWVNYSTVIYPIPLGWLFRNEYDSRSQYSDKLVILELTNVYLCTTHDSSYIEEIPPGWQTICQFNINGNLEISENDALPKYHDVLYYLDGTQKIYPFTKAEMREKQIKTVLE